VITISLITTLDFLQQQFPTFHQLLDLSTKSVFIFLLALTLRFFYRRQSASMLSLFWLSAIVSLLLLPLFSSVLPEISLSIPVNPEQLTNPSTALSPPGIGEANFVTFLNGQPSWLIIIEFLYLGIASVMIAYLACGIVRLFFISQLAKSHQDIRAYKVLEQLKATSGVDCNIQLLTSPRISSPITWGIWQHRIIFPVCTEHWSQELLTHVIGHELAHIQRKDWLSFILARLTLCLYWPNPLVWVAQKSMVLEAEKACDDIAIDNSTGPFSYAENLVYVASTIFKPRTTLSPAMYGNRSQLKLRVQHALKTNRATGNFDFSDILPSILLIAVIAAPISALSLDFHLTERMQADQSRLIPLQFMDRKHAASPAAHSDRFDDPVTPAASEILPETPQTIVNQDRAISFAFERPIPYEFSMTSYQGVSKPYQTFSDTRPLLIANPSPQYPGTARSKGIEGYVVAEYSVSPSGKTRTIKIIESTPERIFDRSVIRAISQYSYQPMLLDSQYPTDNTIRRKYVFSLNQ